MIATTRMPRRSQDRDRSGASPTAVLTRLVSGHARGRFPSSAVRSIGPFVLVGEAGGRCYSAPAVRIPLLLYGLAVAVRLVLIAHFPYPAYPDSAYYVDVARSLHAGTGFNVDFIWIFAEVGAKIPADPMLPIPSNAHWMPLA